MYVQDKCLLQLSELTQFKMWKIAFKNGLNSVFKGASYVLVSYGRQARENLSVVDKQLCALVFTWEDAPLVKKESAKVKGRKNRKLFLCGISIHNILYILMYWKFGGSRLVCFCTTTSDG